MVMRAARYLYETAAVHAETEAADVETEVAAAVRRGLLWFGCALHKLFEVSLFRGSAAG